MEFSGVRLINSPQFYVYSEDIVNFWLHDFEIRTDIMGQMVLGQLFGEFDYMGNGFLTLPAFPFNTDGIDFSGKNVLVERIKITNFDDAVVVKPSRGDDVLTTCSENIMVRDCEVNFGVGMSIGSVGPKDSYNCIRDVTFVNHTFYHPLKAVYVKTNPGSTTSGLPGSGGEITDVTYKNLYVHHPLWWSIYIGPQQ